MGTLRAVLILSCLAVATAIGIPLQALALRASPAAARRIPVLYHRLLLALLGVRVRVEGRPAEGRPLLFVANHVSWLDIPLLSTLAPLSFVAKREVGTWPVVRTLARLQRTIFVDRERRSATAGVREEMAGRLAAGDVLVLFAEGTSSDGNRVLPFKTALFGAIPAAAGEVGGPLLVQPLAIAYTRINGVPMGRQHRPLVAWNGDKELAPHIMALLRTGPVDVTVAFGPPLALSAASDRKAAARHSEDVVRRMGLAALAGRPAVHPLSAERESG